MKKLAIDIDIATDSKTIPSKDDVKRWVNTVLNNVQDEAELSIKYVDIEESAQLNSRFRHKEGPTNVLSFPFEAPDQIPIALLGDLVICAPIVEKEAQEQSKNVNDHWAHMIIHGTLHLLGYDHIDSHDALIMEGLEISLMEDLGLGNPYENGQLPDQGLTHPLQPPSCS